MDTANCFCFECDAITRDVLEYYPHEPVNRVLYLLKDKHPEKELLEVIGELEYLRVTKAILTPENDRKWMEEAQKTAALKRLTLCSTTEGTAALVEESLPFLLGRSGTETELTLILRCTGGGKGLDEEALATLQRGVDAARAAGKRLSLELDIPIVTKDLHYPDCAFRGLLPLADLPVIKVVREVLWIQNTLKSRKFLEALNAVEGVGPLQLVVQPGTAKFSELFKTVSGLGFRNILLDLPHLWMNRPDLQPGEVAAALTQCTQDFANLLLRNEQCYFEPVGSLFKAIRDGEPCLQRDPAVLSSLAIAEDRAVYPSVEFLLAGKCSLGNLTTGTMDDTRWDEFHRTGVLQRSECLRCWAQGLCGGGHTAIHFSRSGAAHRVDPHWCEVQRQWIQLAIALFTPLSASTASFDPPATGSSGAGQKIKWGTALKALFTDHILARPLQEADAPWRVRWENWNDAACFLCTETSILTTTIYDREMDATHPRSGIQEYVLTEKNGTPCGLIKMQHDPIRQLGHLWLYMHEPASYGRPALVTTLKKLMDQLAGLPRLRHLLVFATEKETELMATLEILGFQKAGIQREALYRRGRYESVQVFSYRIPD
jgi:radical SAM protein with 4Fe4S-binding SPASM domain